MFCCVRPVARRENYPEVQKDPKCTANACSVIGTASYLKSRGVTKLIAKAGPIPITFGADELVSASIPHNTHLNSRTLASQASHSGLCADPQVRAAELDAPPFSIVPGMTFVLIRLPSFELLAKPVVGPFAFDKSELMDEGWRDTYVGRSYYVVTGSEVDEKGARVVSIRTRMIEPMLEDPATGSAACALTSYLSLHEFGETELRFQVTQGVEMGRRSDISVEVDVRVDEKGGRAIRGLRLGGTARQIMKGTIAVPPA